eukprot:scaffold34630_cov185-Amphora_coffeaeformis.AAC.17
MQLCVCNCTHRECCLLVVPRDTRGCHLVNDGDSFGIASWPMPVWERFLLPVAHVTSQGNQARDAGRPMYANTQIARKIPDLTFRHGRL